MTKPKFFKSRNPAASGRISEDIYNSFDRNVKRIRDAGWYFGRDGTGLAYIVVNSDQYMVSGPWTAPEMAAYYGVKKLAKEEMSG